MDDNQIVTGEDKEVDNFLIPKEIWRDHVISYFAPSEILTFKQTSKLGQEISADSLSGRILVASGHAAFIFDTQTTKLLQTLKGTDIIRCCKFSRDGSRVVTASWDRIANIWDSRTGTLIKTLRGHRGAVVACEFSPNDTRVVTASADNSARVWISANGSLIIILQHLCSVWSCAFSPDGRRIVTAGFNSIALLWDAETGKCQLSLQREHNNILTCCCFSHDGKYILTSSHDMTTRIWNVMDGTLIKTLRHENWVYNCAFSFDDKLIVTACKDNTVRIWETQSGQLKHTLDGHTDDVQNSLFSLNGSSCFSTDGNRIISGCRDRTARIWDAHTGEVLSEFRFNNALGGCLGGCDFTPHYHN